MLTEQKIKELRAKYNIPEQGVSNTQKSPSESIARRRLLASEYDKQKEQTKSRLAETWEDVKQIGSNIKSRFTDGADKIAEIQGAQESGEQGVLQSAFQKFGVGAGAASGAFGDIFTGIVKGALSQEQEDAVKNKVGEVATSVMENPLVSESLKASIGAFKNLDENTQRNLEALFNTGMLALDVATLGGSKKLVEKGIETGIDLAKKGKMAVGEGINTAIDTAKEITPKIIKSTEKAFSKKPPTSIEAVGQVLQGKPQDIAQGVKSFANIGVEDVKTFKDLGTKIKNKIVELSKQVDVDLAVDTTKRKLNDLALEAKSAGGKLIKSNPVKDAIDHLVEVYTKVGEKVKATNMKELLSRAKTEGLTSLEINQLARDYGMEFGSKAFNKMGDALTSVNAKLYENTRKALKDLARQGIKGEEAKLADQTMTSLYNTERLIKKNIEAVNKLKQKIDEMGLVEKIGHSITKYTDKLSGGSLRGLIGGLLPRGAGYKVMNALDLEEVLQRNLKIIQDAIKSGNDKDIIKILEKLNKSDDVPLPKGKGEIPETIERAKNLSEQDIALEDMAYQKLYNNPEKAVDNYIKNNKNIVNTDNARIEYKDIGYKGYNAATFQEPASRLWKMVQEKLLRTSEKLRAMFFSGGSGTGKTSVAKNILGKGYNENYASVLDGNLSSLKSALRNIELAKKYGKVPEFLYIYREPVDSMVNGVVKRMINNKAEGGRLVPAKVVADNHKSSLEVIKELYDNAEKYGLDKSDFTFIDNSRGIGNAKKISRQELDKIKYPSNLEDMLKNEIKKLYTEGKINKIQYEKYIE